MSAKALDDFTSARRHTGFDPDAVVALLSSTGLSRADIADVVAADPLFLHSRVDRLGPRLRDLRDSIGLSAQRVQEVLLRAEELGVPRSSGMFKHVVSALSCATRQKDTARLEFFRRTLGCSKNEVAIAVYKVPAILILSEQSLLRKIQFLVNDVGLEPHYIMERSMLFTAWRSG